MNKVRYLAVALFIACGSSGGDDQGSGDNPAEFNEKCFTHDQAPDPLDGQLQLQEGDCEPFELDVLAYDELCGTWYDTSEYHIDGCYWTGITEKGCEEEKEEGFTSVRYGDCVWEYAF